MNNPGHRATNQYWERDGIGAKILEEMRTSGHDLDHLTIHDLAVYDQFHGGGMSMTMMLAGAVSLQPGMRVLDVGGGLGGPARTLATEFGCDVTVVDLTESYLEAGRLLTSLLKMESSVHFARADALDLPFENGAFDLIWTQNSGMNIQDKERLYRGFHRLLRPGGVLAIQEPVAGEIQPPVYPLMWARDESENFLRTAEEMILVITGAGFTVQDWQDVTTQLVSFRQTHGYKQQGIQLLVMGEQLDAILAAAKQNTEERRVISMQGVFHRIDRES